jgi:hypothetical protein
MRLLLFALLSSLLSLTAVAGVGTTLSFTGDTTSTSAGATDLRAVSTTAATLFYKVVTGGGGAGAEITASTCGSANFQQRRFVWQGASSACSSFACTGTSGQGWWTRAYAIGLLPPLAFLTRLLPTHSDGRQFVREGPNSKGCAPDGLDDFGYDDDSLQSGASVRRTPATVGAEYYVQVAGDFPYETGQYTLTLSSASSFSAEKVDGA